MYHSKQASKRRVFNAVLKTQTVALAHILFGSVFHAFAADRAPHEFFDLCSVLFRA